MIKIFLVQEESLTSNDMFIQFADAKFNDLL